MFYVVNNIYNNKRYNMSKNADGAKNGKGKDTEASDNKDVVLTQDKLDKLINKGYGKGQAKATEALVADLGVGSLDDLKAILKAKTDLDEANKTDLEKAASTIETLTNSLAKAEGVNKALTADAVVERLASDNGANDKDYFKHLYAKASKDDTFDKDTYITKLKKDKPFLFVVAEAKNIDASPNAVPTSISAKIKAAKTMKELRAIQQAIG